MNKFKRLLWFSLVVAMLLPGTFVRAEDIDLVVLTQEIQKMSQKPEEMTMVMWLPEEFWKASISQTPGVTATQIEEFLQVFRPHTMLAVVDGSMGAFGGVTYKSEDWIRANTHLVDAKGTSYVPKTEDEFDADTKNMIQMLKPIMVNMLGPMGQNLHFLLFPAKTSTGEPIASAKDKGEFKVKIGTNEFKWRLPLDALLPVKVCGECKQECKGSWSFCPWCGKNLAQR